MPKVICYVAVGNGRATGMIFFVYGKEKGRWVEGNWVLGGRFELRVLRGGGALKGLRGGSWAGGRRWVGECWGFMWRGGEGLVGCDGGCCVILVGWKRRFAQCV